MRPHYTAAPCTSKKHEVLICTEELALHTGFQGQQSDWDTRDTGAHLLVATYMVLECLGGGGPQKEWAENFQKSV